MRGLRWGDPRPVHLEGGPQPGVARGLPQVLRVSDVSRRKLYLLCQRRKDLLQEGLRQVRRPHLRNGEARQVLEQQPEPILRVIYARSLAPY